MRRLFQFRLRTLFVLVTIAALAALWWSHRLYCLNRAEFHRAEIARCRERQVIDTDEFVAAYAKQRNPTRRPKGYGLARAIFVKQTADMQKAYAGLQADADKRIADAKAMVDAEMMKQRARFGSLDASRSRRWEDQSVHDSMAQGFLVVPAPGANRYSRPRRVVENEPQEPDLVTPYEAKAAALSREIEIHGELVDKYLRAIYRPWIRVDESELSESKGR